MAPGIQFIIVHLTEGATMIRQKKIADAMDVKNNRGFYSYWGVVYDVVFNFLSPYLVTSKCNELF